MSANQAADSNDQINEMSAHNSKLRLHENTEIIDFETRWSKAVVDLQFLHHLSRIIENANCSCSDILALNSDGTIRINNALDIHPEAFMQLDCCSSVFVVTRQKQIGTLSLRDYMDKLKKTPISEGRILFREQVYDARIIVITAFGGLREMQINDWNILRDIREYQWNKMRNCIVEAGEGNERSFAEVVRSFAARKQCKNNSDLCSLMEFIYKFVCLTRIGKGSKGSTLLLQQMCCQDSKDKDKMERSKLLHERLKTEFESLLVAVEPLNDSSDYKFISPYSATYHVYKHALSTSSEIAKQYFNSVNKLFSNSNNFISKRVSQDAGIVSSTYKATLADGHIWHGVLWEKRNVVSRSYVATAHVIG